MTMDVFSNILDTLLFLYSLLSCYDRNIDLNKKFDFIVVGAGSAGGVVASRLSENPNVNVLLIEAGDCPPFFKYIPVLMTSKEDDTIFWSFNVLPQRNSFLSVDNQRPVFPQGKLLGGSSGVNAMMYIRGNRYYDFDYWKSLGNDGWGYDDVLPYFRKSEGNTIPGQMDDIKYHNTSGPLRVSYTPYSISTIFPFLLSGMENGYQIVDVNGESQTESMYEEHLNSFAKTPFTMFNGARSSIFTDYLAPALDRPNLVILTNSLVTKVLFNSNKQAVGVEYILNNVKYTVNASREVILSAGALNTPKILMLSGIGKTSLLNSLKIPVVAGLEGVGSNLHDHVAVTFLSWKINCAGCISNEVPAASLPNFINWLIYRNGPMSTIGNMDAVAFINTKYANPNGQEPDIELQFSTMNVNGSTIVYAIIANVHPLSRGYVTINTTDPQQLAIVDFNYLGNTQDVNVLVEGMKEVAKLINSSSFQNFSPQFDVLNTLHCANFNLFSDEYWGCVARYLTGIQYHAAGTCKMGKQSDSMAVVNSQLQVYQVNNLRVIDTSIMPRLTSGNTNAPAVMIGEKGAAIVKSFYNI